MIRNILLRPCLGRSRRLSRLMRGSVILLAALAASSVAAAGSPEPDSPESGNHTSAVNATFSYLRLAGSSFHPISTPAPYSYSGVGCIQPDGASGERRFHHKVILPQGALVKYVRLYYKNTAASGSGPAAFFTTYDAKGNYNELSITAGSPGGTGYSSTLSSEMNYFVDHIAEPINVLINLGSVSDGTVQFCGVRIAYYTAEEAPPIFKDGFE